MRYGLPRAIARGESGSVPGFHPRRLQFAYIRKGVL